MPDDLVTSQDAPGERTPDALRRGPRTRGSGQGAVTGVVVAAAVIAALYFGQDVLVPITVATLLSFLLSPLMELLRRLWLGRVVSALLAVLLAIAIIVGLGAVIGTEIAGLIGQVPQYRTTIDAKVSSLQTLISANLKGLSGFVDKLESLGPTTPEAAPSGAPSSLPRRPEPVTIARSPTFSALAIGQRILTPLLSPIVTLGLILLVTTFILLQKHDVRDRLIRLFAPRDLNRATVALDDAARLLSHYFLGKLAINCAFGVVVAAGLVIIGVPNPVLWGILGVLLRFVPYFGAYLAAILPFLLAAAVGHGWSMALWTVALFAGSEFVLGNAVEPLLFGRTTGLSPLAVMIAAIFWAWLWGLVGLILSTPLTLCLVVLGRHVPELAFLDILLGDRPALSPAENFYQRVLAGDPDEAAGLAEHFLEERALPEFYDEVALAALQLAAADANKGLLAEGEVERIKRAAGAVIQELDARKDALTSAARRSVFHRAFGTARSGEPRAQPVVSEAAASDWRDTSVLCIAGRGPLDEVVAAMLVQLLATRGIKGRVVSHEAVSRANIASLETAGVRTACILYLDIVGVPAHLHFVVRRLKERLPGVPVMIGLWARQDAFFKNERAQKALGADTYVASLRQTLAICRSITWQGEEHPSDAATSETEAL